MNAAPRSFRTLPAAWRRLLLLAGLLFGALIFWADGGFEPMLSREINQHRLSVVLPVPDGTVQIEQTFTAARNGLAAVELLLARRSEPESDEDGRLTLQLHDEAGELIAERTLATGRYQHNQSFFLRFPPQTSSANQSYTLTLSGNEANPLTVWGYELDSISDGALRVRGAESDAADLRLLTHTQLTTGLALQDLGRLLYASLPIFLNFLLIVLLPGLFILRLLPITSRWDPAVYYAVAITLGLTVWPFLWLWPSLLGWRWGVWTVRSVIVLGWALYLRSQRVAAKAVRYENRSERPAGSARRPDDGARHLPWTRWHLLLLGILAIALASRLLVVRDQAFPLWVDSSRHGLIVELLRQTGRFPTNYLPLLPVDQAGYHYGFHVVPALMGLLVPGATHTVLLYLGQYLNALVPLMAYSGLWLLTRNRNAGLLAAFLIALPFFFPAYYVTWGRFTQLTGMLILPVLLAVTWQLMRGVRRQRLPLHRDPRIWLIGLLAGGLLLIHVRVFLLYLPFAGLIWLVSAGRNGRRLLVAGLGAIALTLPQLIRLSPLLSPDIVLAPVAESHNAFPTTYLTVGWETALLYAAALLFALALFVNRRRQRHLALPVLLLLWVGLLFLSLAGERVGLPESWLISLNSAYITMFLPLAWLMALSLRLLLRRLNHSHWIGAGLSYAILGFLLAQSGLFGWQQQLTLLNETTMLAQPPDEAGLIWVRDNLPADATIAHGAWDWLGGVWAGSDGGAWLVPVTGRFSTTPPIDYYYSDALWQQVQAFNREGQSILDWSHPAAVDWLHQHDVDYVYVGARGGYLEPLALARNPRTDLLYASDGVYVFGLK
ncbi:MAG: hypothetical protein KDE04_12605 [Anaerolineales bacterium]|nr:hypothetical protein [Anaerolineales bacterium]